MKIKENIAVGDICLLNYHNMQKDKYKLCKVTKVFPDEKMLVRSATVQYRKSDKRDKVNEYQKGRLVSECVPIQGLCLLFSTTIPDDENDYGY